MYMYVSCHDVTSLLDGIYYNFHENQILHRQIQMMKRTERDYVFVQR